MAIEAFLVLTGMDGHVLPGETNDPYFGAPSRKAVKILEFSFGIHNTTTIGSGSAGSGAGRAQFTALKVKKVVDSVSPALLSYAGGGSGFGHLRQLDLYLRTMGEAGAGFLRYSFKLVYVTDLEWSGGTGEDSVAEEVTFAYGALQIAYTPAGGGPVSVPPTSWNVVSNDGNFSDPRLG